jgi:MFS family permease
MRDAVGLLLGTVLLGLGEKACERFIPLQLENLGGGAAAVGLFQSSSNLLGAFWALPGGFLSDRLGVKRALQGFVVLAAAGFLILWWGGHWALAILGSLLFLSWSAISLPAALDLVTRSLPTRNTTWGVSLHSIVRRIPMALGPLIGGAWIARFGEQAGLHATYATAIGLAAAAWLAQQLLIRGRNAKAGGPAPQSGAAPAVAEAAGPSAPARRFAFDPLRAWRRMSPPLRELLAADILIRFCEQIPYAFVILWCMRVIDHPVTAFQFAQLTAIEMLTALVAYLPGAWLSTRIGKPAMVALTFVLFFIFPLVLLVSRSFIALIGAFAVRGLKELGEPTRKGLILDLCPPDERATHFGWYYFIRDSFAAAGAAAGAWAWSAAPAAALWLAAGFGLAGVLFYAGVALRTGSGAARPRRSG